jgi:hypothetical protein
MMPPACLHVTCLSLACLPTRYRFLTKCTFLPKHRFERQ